MARTPPAAPRPNRSLRAGTPEVITTKAGDGLDVRLTRYRGGCKGPVLLSHGLGVSSLIFAADTIETNLLEYLVAREYDVWLLDYRNSIALPSAARRSTADDVALRDYPAAVEAVLARSGASTVQVVAHCYGASTFFMAMLAGLKGVRSAVASQVAAHMVSPLGTELKCGLHLPTVLDSLGVGRLTADVEDEPGWAEKLYDKALSLNALAEAQGHCDSAVCHRITFMYGSLYRHEQLNDATHENLGELFGVASISAFEHLARMVRAGHVVSADGANSYLPHLGRLDIPILFIHGSENRCFLPESTALTYELLCSHNRSAKYDRKVVPGYGHIDCIFGRRAAEDVYPLIGDHLDAT